ncbi:MAG: GGDEF domain-containing phosphodiesterase [Lachnospiraceae bacterium]|nr:EAL domain-containing protein [Robinsoniella sp.]MDY3765293.1 GGDEF domain-containing phosphodiesterase [Lachnospiraceae bacterium]
MNSNINFLLVSLIFLLLILYHFINHKKLENSNNRIFRLFILLGIMDILFDLVTTLLISDGEPDLTGLTLFLLTAFYILQVLVPHALFLYTWSLCETSSNTERTFYYILSLPAIIVGIMVLCNVRTGIFFFIDEGGNYIRGTFYLGMYLYAGLYVIIILISSIFRYRKLGFKNFCIVCEFLIIMGTCVSVQAVRNELLTTGLGLGLGITALYLTINNPSDYLDRLTKDFNLQSLLGWLQELYRKKRNFHVLTVTILNLRQVNMLFGMSFGNAFLCEISQKLNAILGTPYIFRVSNERFVLLTYSLQEYERVRAEIQNLFKGSLHLDEEKIQLSAVICGVVNAKNLKSSDALVAYVEYLSSLAPASLGTLMIQSDEKIMKGFQYNKDIEHFLRTAIDEDLFEIFYQPVFSIEKGTYITMEALSRLRHPSLGYVSPEIFIPIAECNGQIAQIGQLQFRRVCQFVKDHPDLMKKIEHVNFNLSPAELLRDGYSQSLIDIIQEFSLPFSFFQFEITETVATEYSETLYQLVESFTKCGIKLSLDDFGSGYANLNAVLRLPFSSIKLDRSLLNGILEDEKAVLFYQNIVTALKSMRYHVISEGVEHKEEAALLKSFGVDLIQGFYFSKPLSPEELLQLMSLD